MSDMFSELILSLLFFVITSFPIPILPSKKRGTKIYFEFLSKLIPISCVTFIDYITFSNFYSSLPFNYNDPGTFQSYSTLNFMSTFY